MTEHKDPSYWKKRRSAFGYAFEGLAYFFKNEAHAKIHLAAAGLAIVLGIVLPLSLWEWLVIAGVICLVLISELFNTAIERLSDALTKEKDTNIKIAKDVGAAGVILASLFALIAGAIIFIPKIAQQWF